MKSILSLLFLAMLVMLTSASSSHLQSRNPLPKGVKLGKAGPAAMADYMAMGQRAGALDSPYMKQKSKEWEERMRKAGNFKAIEDSKKMEEKIRKEKLWARDWEELGY